MDIQTLWNIFTGGDAVICTAIAAYAWRKVVKYREWYQVAVDERRQDVVMYDNALEHNAKTFEAKIADLKLQINLLVQGDATSKYIDLTCFNNVVALYRHDYSHITVQVMGKNGGLETFSIDVSLSADEFAKLCADLKITVEPRPQSEMPI